VEPDPRQILQATHEAGKFVREAERLMRFAVGAAAERVRRWIESREQAAPKSAAEIAKMSPAERIDYCRRFDQNKMPNWREPRSG
jgi:hypothetical protein